MLASKQLPVVFLANVEDHGRERYIRNLAHECRTISQLLNQPTLPYYQPVEKGKLSTEYYLNLLDQFPYYQRITHLHLVGHAGQQRLSIQHGHTSTDLTLDDLGPLVDALPRLRCVFLSGCANTELIDLLLRKDVPAVIATQAFDDGRRSSLVSQSFYQYLSRGESLFDSFRLIKHQFTEMDEYQVDYDVETDQIDGMPPLVGGNLKWGLYYLKENADQLRHRPARRPVVNFQPNGPRWRRRQHWKKISTASIALIIGLLTVTLVLALRNSAPQILLSSF
ncbi:MAG: hypothetical protein AAF804_02210 [Bacteroidota bacterium]